jgi:hypothetical protein
MAGHSVYVLMRVPQIWQPTPKPGSATAYCRVVGSELLRRTAEIAAEYLASLPSAPSVRTRPSMNCAPRYALPSTTSRCQQRG